MSASITIFDPEIAKMFEEKRAASMADIPYAVWLGRTQDGRTREDFENEDAFEDLQVLVSIKNATIADISAHLAYEGKKVREAYLSILRLTMIRDKILEEANGDTSANFLEFLNGHQVDDKGGGVIAAVEAEFAEGGQ